MHASGNSKMANPWHHAVSSAKKHGGVPKDYLAIHEWFDKSKAHHADFRHRALRHHAWGIDECVDLFGKVLDITVGFSCEGCGERFGVVEDGLPDLSAEHSCVTNGISAVLTPIIKKVPVRWVAEQHVREDLNCIPAATDWLRNIKPEPWMSRSRALSVEQEKEEARA